MDQTVKKHGPQVTVLMPVYNAATYLKEAIDSILNQTFTDFEFLIINDGSTDESTIIIDSYTDSRIRHVHLPQNKGVINALNKGLELAQGKYIARMDADDIALRERLARQVKFMDGHPEVGVAGSWVQYFGAKNAVIKPAQTHAEICWTLLFGSALYHSSVIMRTEFILVHAIRYPADYPHAEDYALWIELALQTKLANIPEVLLMYRWSDKQVTSKFEDIQKHSAERLRRKMHEILLGEIIPDASWQSIDRFGACKLSITQTHSIYSNINLRNHFFNARQFQDKFKILLGSLIPEKEIDIPSRIWLLKNSFREIIYFRYFMRYFID